MLVGICGKAGSGKDTIADYLIEKHGFTKISLADPIKRLVKDVFVLDDKTVYDRIEREKELPQWGNWSVRKLLQFIGTEMFRRNIDDSIWVKSLWYRIEAGVNENNYVISDIRFPNELEYFQRYAKKDFTAIKVVRNGQDGSVGLKGHESESYDLPIKQKNVIINNGTLKELYAEVDRVIKLDHKRIRRKVRK